MAFARVDLRQTFQRVIKRHHLCGALFRNQHRFIQLHFLHRPTTLLFVATARMVNQNAPHNLSGDGEEVCAVLPLYVLSASETQISLVNQS